MGRPWGDEAGAGDARSRALAGATRAHAQGVVSSGRWSATVKRLAYDLCKAVPLSDADTQYILSGIRVRALQTSGAPAGHLGPAYRTAH